MYLFCDDILIVPLCESSDFRQTSISIQTSLELLVNSLYHLPRPSVSQSMDADLNPQHYRSKLTDVVKVLTTHIAQVLEVSTSLITYTYLILLNSALKMKWNLPSIIQYGVFVIQLRMCSLFVVNYH